MEVVVKHYNELSVEELYIILQARMDVFVIEQNCIYRDLDNKDKNAYHVMVYDNGELCAYARVLDRGVTYDEVCISRVITLKRKKGYGKILIDNAIKAAKEKFNASCIIIGAQVQAMGFYQKCGFKEYGDIFLEDNILHIHMKISL